MSNLKNSSFSVQDMSVFLKISKSAVRERIRQLNIHEEFKEENKRYFSKSDYEKIENYLIDKKPEIILYEPFRIETTYHIYESKINYLPEEML